MRIEFVTREGAPERLVCEAEVVFDDDEGWEGACPTCGSTSALRGMKLVGFSLWRSPEGEVYVTFPSRAFGAGQERRFFDFLRSAEGNGEAGKRVKAWIRGEYEKTQGHERDRSEKEAEFGGPNYNRVSNPDGV